MTIPVFDEETIRANCTDESFSRGEDYYADGSVLSIVRRGDQLHAEVQGSEYRPYAVTVELDGDQIVDALCTCPYDWGGWCKHIVAALLACGEAADLVEERQPLSELLAGLDASRLRDLIEKVAAERPDILPLIEQWLSVMPALKTADATTPQTSGAAVTVSVDLAAIRRQVQAIARRGVDGIDFYVEQVQQLLNNGHVHDALAVLDAITDEVMSSIDNEQPNSYRGDRYHGDYYDDEDDAGSEYHSLFEEMGALWAEVLLSAELSAEERAEYQEQLSEWDEELAAVEWLGEDEFFALAIGALDYYWDYPPLQRVLQGEITHLGAWEDEDSPAFVDELAIVRLRVLERQGHLPEYLYLAQAEGQTTLYINMLAQMGRSAEAVSEALQFLPDAQGAQIVADTLYARGEVQAALQVAEHGLGLQGMQKHALAVWLCDRAMAAGDQALGLRAGTAAVLEAARLADYLRLQEIAGDSWQAMREGLLGQLRTQKRAPFGADAIDIFLHEGLIDDAIAALGAYASDGKVVQVMQAAKSSRPDWVIQTAQKRAEAIMNAGKAPHYDSAVQWLGRAKEAYLAADRRRQWENYLAQVRETHGRKYKLMGLLKGM